MDQGAETTIDPMQTVATIFARETWSRTECSELFEALYGTNDAADKFRTLAGEALRDQQEATMKSAILKYMLGKTDEALETFAQTGDDADSMWFRACCLRQMDKFPEAAEAFNKAASSMSDPLEAAVAAAQCMCLAGDFDTAERAVTDLAGKCSTSSEYSVLRGMVLENAGLSEQAAEAYAKALEMDAKCSNAAFRLAVLADRCGDDETAIEMYNECMAIPPVTVGAALNLAVIFEDLGQWDNAATCLHTVLDIQPNHPRAKLFLRDVDGSRFMFYDEDQERRTVQRNAVLDIPVTDFELSVRARNCLKKMNINSLGDLMKVTEADLLGSKNFGETSLVEIKTMLSQKGLTLGQDVPQAPTAESGMLEPEENALLLKTVSELELSVRARKALERLDIGSIGELTTRSEAELLACKNFGQTSLNEIKQRLTELGLNLRTR